MAEQEITQEELEEVRKLRQAKEQQKPVDFKGNVKILMTALERAKVICRYDVIEKGYPSNLKLFYDEGRQVLENPTIVQYIKRAECNYIKAHQAEVMQIVVEEIQKEIDEIREVLG